jgi:predicted GIY-YIG superfamily endonuclease
MPIPFVPATQSTLASRASTGLKSAEARSAKAESGDPECQLKKWNRAWKLELIERGNPAWRDLASDLTP